MSDKKTTPWEIVPSYPCPCQCLASRDVKGIHWQLFSTTKSVVEEKNSLLFWNTVTVREEQIYKLYHGDFSKEISREEAMKILEKA